MLHYFYLKTVYRLYSFQQTHLLSTQPIVFKGPYIRCGHIYYIYYIWEHLTRHTRTLVLGSPCAQMGSNQELEERQVLMYHFSTSFSVLHSKIMEWGSHRGKKWKRVEKVLRNVHFLLRCTSTVFKGVK